MTVTIGYDVTSLNYDRAPKGQQLALYVTGSLDIAATPVQLRANPGAVLIDQTPVPGLWDATADVDDVENGAVALSEIAQRAKLRITAFQKGVRPGQRMPLVYFSAGRIHDVANALVQGGVTGGVGLFPALWGTALEAAAVQINDASGPFPIMAYQIKNEGLFDLDVFSTAWLNNRSGVKPAGKVPVPPGQWNNPAAWTWKDCIVAGHGLDGSMHSFRMDSVGNQWDKTL